VRTLIKQCGAVVVVIVLLLDLQLPVQSEPITTKIVISNPVHGDVCSIQHYVIKFVNDFRQVGWFSPGTPIYSTNKTDRHNIAAILLKVALNTTTLFPTTVPFFCRGETRVILL